MGVSSSRVARRQREPREADRRFGRLGGGTL
jgi:hypothetical protein